MSASSSSSLPGRHSSLPRRSRRHRAGNLCPHPRRPEGWRPPVEPSAAEQQVIKRIRRAKLFVLLRERRHELFDEAFQQELAATYVDSPRGQPPVPPAQLALATILQAYTGASDDEVVEATVMDRRWQLVLDCLDATDAPFAKGT